MSQSQRRLDAATFYRSGHYEVAEIQDAYKLLSPLLGVGGASAVFALALLASGQKQIPRCARNDKDSAYGCGGWRGRLRLSPRGLVGNGEHRSQVLNGKRASQRPHPSAMKLR